MCFFIYITAKIYIAKHIKNLAMYFVCTYILCLDMMVQSIWYDDGAEQSWAAANIEQVSKGKVHTFFLLLCHFYTYELFVFFLTLLDVQYNIEYVRDLIEMSFCPQKAIRPSIYIIHIVYFNVQIFTMIFFFFKA